MAARLIPPPFRSLVIVLRRVLPETAAYCQGLPGGVHSGSRLHQVSNAFCASSTPFLGRQSGLQLPEAVPCGGPQAHPHCSRPVAGSVCVRVVGEGQNVVLYEVWENQGALDDHHVGSAWKAWRRETVDCLAVPEVVKTIAIPGEPECA